VSLFRGVKSCGAEASQTGVSEPERFSIIVRELNVLGSCPHAHPRPIALRARSPAEPVLREENGCQLEGRLVALILLEEAAETVGLRGAIGTIGRRCGGHAACGGEGVRCRSREMTPSTFRVLRASRSSSPAGRARIQFRTGQDLSPVIIFIRGCAAKTASRRTATCPV